MTDSSEPQPDESPATRVTTAQAKTGLAQAKTAQAKAAQAKAAQAKNAQAKADSAERQSDERQSGVRPPDRRHQRRWVPVTAALLAFLIGLTYIIEGFRTRPIYTHLKHSVHRLNELAPGLLSILPRVADVIIGLLLLMLSHGLRRRKRRAWEAVILLLALSVLTHAALPGRHLVPAAGAVVLLVILWFYRKQFYAVGDPRTRWRALRMFCVLAVADVAIGLVYISVTHGLAASYTFGQRLQSVVWNILGFGGPVQFTSETRGDLFNFLMGGLGLFTLIVVGYLFLRPARRDGKCSGHDASRIRELLGKQGERDSLGYFTLRSDKSIIWSATGKSCIGYRVLSGVMLASGDPIGDPEAWPGAINAFLDEAARHAWVPAVLGCSELGAETWCREDSGLTALELGDEAIVNVADFTLEGRSMRNVRQMVNRVGKHGYAAEVRRVGDIPREQINWMNRQADSWRGSPTERGFSMALGRVGAPGDEDCVVATAVEDGVLRAILHFVPWGPDGLSLDLMRRDRSAQPGLNDFLIVETIKRAPDLGVKRISLNFAMFRAALERGERIGAGPVLRAWRGILLFLSRWFQIESLYKFNAKFCPEWVPRFFVYTGTRDVPRIGLAAMEAEAFLVWPTVEVRRIARRTARQIGLGKLRRWLLRAARRRSGASA
ncbi:MAG TPA: phosphatidylglycerol lysyltransferase domain-containing protein [Streptosporangiaceae bacterium]|nr:phosphatidylglycerol lysyltransferase domain-containing protein [Streptosporangiaceae bacterium]